MYNGKDDLKENGKVVTEKMMKLSDAFIQKNDSENSLELCVKLIDMRLPSHHESLYQENNKEINGNLSLLGEYSYFINKIKELREQNDKLEEAIKKAMDYCIKHNILKEFLLKNETEVMTMLLGIYGEELEKQAIIEETEERERTNIIIGKEREKAK